MSELIGKTISHYRILDQIGQGGMGVVYKAEDTRLKRTVALKFMPLNTLGSGEGKSRFNREAQAAAALNHPHIATIHEIDGSDGQLFIAMEYIDGHNLKVMIEKAPLKVEEAVRIAIDTADGLQTAHEKGIVHRDIKPANIMLTEKSQVKIMDFGLAKFAGKTKLTKTDMTLGTAAYMSPEQAQGIEVDSRSDVFSLGVVLYEMLTGQSPFKGDYEQAVVYSILNEDPEPITGLRTGVPMELERIVDKAMAKSQDERYQRTDEMLVDLRALQKKLADLTGASRISSVARRPGKKFATWRLWLPWGIAALMTFIAFRWWLDLQSPMPSLVKRWTIDLPESAPIAPIGSAPSGIGLPALTLSSDGTNLVYVASVDSITQLFLRPIDQFEATPISGTVGAYGPFFSPDGQWVGFFTANEMKKVSIGGGVPVSLCEVFTPYGANWGLDDRIVFSSNFGTELSWISQAGGTPQVVKKLDRLFWPEILPGGKAVLVSSLTGGVRAITLETGEEKILIDRGQYPRYLNTGHLLYTQGGRLEAVSFDLGNLTVTGSPVPVLDQVRIESTYGGTQYTVSHDGTLIYLAGAFEGESKLVWLDRDNNLIDLQFAIDTYGGFKISPDGSRLAIQVENANENIWIFDLLRGSRSKLTLEGNNRRPVWSPDGKWVAFSSDRAGTFNLFMKQVSGQGEINKLTTSEIMYNPFSWSPNGQLLAVTETPMYDIKLVMMNANYNMQPFASTRFAEWGPVFSPDGRWIAYTADEQGRFDVYVQPFPQTGERWQISPAGGEEPVWSPSSNELFYRNGRKWMTVGYTAKSTFSADVPRMLFEGNFRNVGGISYDVSRDGQRFLLLKSGNEEYSLEKLNVVTNWFEELKRKAPRSK